jgi:hypothetical protein
MSRIALTAAVIMLVATTTICLGEDDKFAFTTSADFYSKYVSRGVNYGNEAVFQPSFYVSRWGFTGSVWGNMDLKNNNDNAGDFTEMDYTVDYTNNVPGIDWLNFSVGNIYYQYPNVDTPNTEEVYGGMGLGCTCGDKGQCLSCLLKPSFKVYRDVDTSKGTYAQFMIGHTIQKFMPITEGCDCNLEAGASLGYANGAYNVGNFDVRGGKFNDLTLSLALPFELKGVTIKPGINYSQMLSNDVREATDRSDNLWGGVSLSYSF